MPSSTSPCRFLHRGWAPETCPWADLVSPAHFLQYTESSIWVLMANNPGNPCCPTWSSCSPAKFHRPGELKPALWFSAEQGPPTGGFPHPCSLKLTGPSLLQMTLVFTCFSSPGVSEAMAQEYEVGVAP